ncbi:MAG: extracellular solute-binding protein [Clostridia bacterium]|nr:extracellular solute-binding protein [Clostridia bacterium]
MKRLLACFLILSMLTATMLATGCAETKQPDETTEAPAATTEPVPETTEAPGDDDLELDPSLNFNNETFTMLLRADRAGAVDEFLVAAEDDNGDTVKTAIVARQAFVEGQLGVTISYETVKESELVERVRNNIASGYVVDVICSAAFQAPTLAAEGLVTNLLDIPHLNFDKVWWGARSGMAENLAIGDQLYMASGDASQLTLGKGLCMYFNENLLKTQGDRTPQMLYDEVNNLNWTIDNLFEISKEYSHDDGNQDWDANDVYGCNIYLKTIIDGYFAAFDQPIVSVENGEYKIAMNNDRMTVIVEKLNKLLYSDNATYITTSKGNSEKFFIEGHTLFTHGGMEWGVDFNGSDINGQFGIIPYPMLDKDQGKYYSALSDVYTMFLVPDNARDLNKIGAVLELTASKSYETTTVAYFEVLLKSRVANDVNAMQMLDIIHDGLCYEFGFTYSAAIGNPAQALRKLLASSSAGNWSSYWASNGSVFQSKLTEMMSQYE